MSSALQSLPSATWKKPAFEISNHGTHRRMSSNSSSSNTSTHSKPFGLLRSHPLLRTRCSQLFKRPMLGCLYHPTQLSVKAKLLQQAKLQLARIPTLGYADFPSSLSQVLPVRPLLHVLQAPIPLPHTAWNVLRLCLQSSAAIILLPQRPLPSIASEPLSLRWTSQ